MNILRGFVLFLIASQPLAGAAKSAYTKSQQRLRKRIEAIILPSRHKHLRAGIIVTSLKSQKVIYELNADSQLIPASVNKLLTAYAALKKLKPTATFKTRVYAGGNIKDGKLSGNLYLKGGGDPLLVSERMWMLVNDLKRTGIRQVTGDLVGDAEYFDKERVPDSRPEYLKDQAYNAPVGALSFNFNSTAIYVKPGEKPGAALIYHTDPPENSYIDVVNQAKTSKKRSRPKLRVSRIEPASGKGKLTGIVKPVEVGDTVLLRGTLPARSKELRFYRNIVNPTLYTTHMFNLFLKRAGIVVAGNVREGVVPKSAEKLVTFESTPLWHIVWGMNKFSNNFTADQIIKKLGAEMWGVPGTLEKGLTALEDALEDIGIKKGSYKIADGSGLTRKSRISARQVQKVLLEGYRDFSIAPELIASLGIAGVDGTLRRRLSNTAARNALRAKTGSLDGVSSLAGYIPSRNGELLAFVILLNDPKRRYGNMRGWVDKITQQIARYEASGSRG